jgi:hypothetical protein
MTDKQKEELLTAFYRERLLPLAEIARERGIGFFPLSGNTDSESYYKGRDDDGNYVHEINSADLAGELEKLWNDLSELKALAAAIAELAETIKEEGEAAEEVSPFIYAMF